MATVSWGNDQHTHFVGRNGCFKCSGITVQTTDGDNLLGLEPLTSRGFTGRCCIEIPASAIDGLIAALQEAKRELQPCVPAQTAPRR